MLMSVSMATARSMGKNDSDNWHFIKNTKDLTLKQMFDISARWVSEKDEISGLEIFGWQNHSWKYLSLLDDEQVISLQRTKVYVFSDSVLSLGKIHENHPNKRYMGTKIGVVQNISGTETLTELTVSQWNSSRIFVQNPIRCSSVTKSKVYWWD